MYIFMPRISVNTACVPRPRAGPSFQSCAYLTSGWANWRGEKRARQRCACSSHLKCSLCSCLSSSPCLPAFAFGARRYTGYIPGLQETFKKTPVMAQVETKDPTPESFVYTRELVPPANYPPARRVH